MKWKAIAQIVGAFAIIWLIAFMVTPYIGYWGLGLAGLLTAVAIGFAIYVWRLTRKSAAVVDILKGATSAEGRLAAIERLDAKGGKDAIALLAKAQLLAQTNPKEAIATLEAIDLNKAPGVVQDDVRANLGLLYLVHGRLSDARPVIAEIRLDRQPQMKARAMYAAVVAETRARSGQAEDARDLLEGYDPDDPELFDIRALLYRAQIYTFLHLKKKGLAAKAMEQLAAIDPNMVASFTQKGAHPELGKIARKVLTKAGVIPKQRTRVRMR